MAAGDDRGQTVGPRSCGRGQAAIGDKGEAQQTADRPRHTLDQRGRVEGMFGPVLAGQGRKLKPGNLGEMCCRVTAKLVIFDVQMPGDELGSCLHPMLFSRCCTSRSGEQWIPSSPHDPGRLLPAAAFRDHFGRGGRLLRNRPAWAQLHGPETQCPDAARSRGQKILFPGDIRIEVEQNVASEGIGLRGCDTVQVQQPPGEVIFARAGQGKCTRHRPGVE